MSLQFADFNRDGFLDMVTTPWQGSVHWVPGSAKGWLLPKRVQDKEGQDIILSMFYDHKAGDYAYANEGDKEHMVSSYLFDWDGDGDEDLLLGAKEGQLYLRRNEGQRGAAAYATGSMPIKLADGSDFDVPGGLTGVRAVDWNGNGRQDLICGSFDGGVYWYPNIGDGKTARFKKPVKLIDAPKVSLGPEGPSRDWYVTPVDYDSDGDLDLLVGGHFEPPVKKVELTDEMRVELRELRKRQTAISKKARALKRRIQKENEAKEPAQIAEALEAAKALPENAAIYAEAKQIYSRIKELQPVKEKVSGVWLYRRVGPVVEANAGK